MGKNGTGRAILIASDLLIAESNRTQPFLYISQLEWNAPTLSKFLRRLEAIRV